MMDDSRTPVGLSGLGSRRSPFSSPYLDFDPKIINPAVNESQWIFPDGAVNRTHRGRFEMAFSQIGGSVMTGGALGGLIGLSNGLKETRSTVPLSYTVRRSQLLNYITKNGANTANAFGVVAVIYSVIGVGLSFIEQSNDDINTVVSAVTTGVLYGGLSSPKSKPDASGITAAARQVNSMRVLRAKRAGMGAAAGLAVSLIYLLFTKSDEYLSKSR